jgi:hypothetical protein
VHIQRSSYHTTVADDEAGSATAEQTIATVLIGTPYLDIVGSYALQGLARTVQVLTGKLTDAQAQQALDPVLQAMPTTTGSGALWGLATALQALAGKLTDVQAQQVLATSFLQRAFGWSATSDESAAWAGAITSFLGRAGEPHYASAIVELLKQPVAAGPATEVLLRALHQAIPAAPGPEAGLPANLRWIAQTYPRIDLLSAPACL